MSANSPTPQQVRYKGRVIVKGDGTNPYFPKFALHNPAGYDVIYNDTELAAYPSTQVICEPTKDGLALNAKTMYAMYNGTTLLFDIKTFLGSGFLWGNKVTTFTDKYDFSGNPL